LYDASSANYKAAIRLDHVNNSLIIENNCSNNGHIGIILYEHCNNNTIKRNIMHDNQNAGISLRYSPHNTIIDNWIANSTGAFGVYLLQSHYATFSNNTVLGSSAGIRVHATEHITVYNNTFELNQVGISLRHGHYSIITQNRIYSSSKYGIFSDTTAFCEISDNFIYNTTYDGIRLIDNSHDNEIYSNEIEKSFRYGAYMYDANVNNNTLYMNYFIDNDVNAVDNGTDNYWDNGSIGNYWDDYTGVDLNDDGIGDIPYNIAGSSGAQDNYPIWDDGDDISVNGGVIPGYNLIVILSISLVGIIGMGYPIKRRNS
ncbi:MAG: NosD domain-containing protein, partial [Promethearchaeia archaeon]